MSHRRHRLLAAPALALLSAALIACAPQAGPAAPTEAPATSTVAPPTAAPTAPAAEPTAPAPAPTAAPAGALLPTGATWVRLGGEVLALAEGAAPHVLAASDPSLAWALEVAPNGAALAYSDRATTTQIVVDDNITGASLRLPADGAGEPGEPRFSPDGRSLAYTLFGPERWQLRVADLESGEERVLAEGSSSVVAGPVTPLLAIRWTPAGLWVRQVLWASDAPPQAVSLLDPSSGAPIATRQGQHIWAEPAPDGARVALVLGEQPIGGQPSAEVRVVDLATGEERELAARQPVVIQNMRWSPDGARLLYAAAAGYGASPATITLVGADGSAPQTMSIGGDGGPLLQDLAWADAATPLALTATPDILKAELYALNLSAAGPDAMRLLEERPLPAPDALARIVYTPGQ